MIEGWWNQTEAPVADLAKRLALRFGHGDADVCLPYPAQIVAFPSGEATMVRNADLVPVWSQFIDLARHALATRDEQAVDAVVGRPMPAPDDLPVTFTDDPDAAWRRERGLDGENQE
jgi:hypothetical protein